MITNVSLATVYCLDQDATRDFYVDVLGFELRSDVTMGGFRWVTVGHPSQPELDITLEALNLTDEFQDQYVGAAGDRLSYYHHQGRQYLLGARYKF